MAAEAAGLRISPSELSATHRRDLISRPCVQQLDHGAGTESIYPAGTSRQVIAYCRLKQKFGTDYQRVGWELWLLGYPVREQYWRPPFRHASDTLDYAVRAVIATKDNQAPGLTEKAMAAVEKISRGRSPTRFFGRLRRSVRSGSETVCRMALEVAAGCFGPARYFDPSEDKYQNLILGRVLKLEAARNKRKIVPAKSPFNISVCELVDMLRAVSREFAKEAKNKISISSEEEQHRVASYEISVLLNVFAQMEKVEMQNSGRSTPTLALLAAITRDMNVSRQAFLIKCWMVARRIPAVREGAQRYLDAIQSIATHQPTAIPTSP